MVLGNELESQEKYNSTTSTPSIIENQQNDVFALSGLDWGDTNNRVEPRRAQC